MEEKWNKLYEKEAELINISARAESIHNQRVATEAKLAKCNDMEAVK